MCQRSDGRGRTGAGDGRGRPRSRPRTAAPNRTAACPTAVGLARRAPGTRGGIRSDEAVGAPRAVQQIRARAALDDPVADLGEALRVRQGIEQPRQPRPSRHRISGLPGGKAAPALRCARAPDPVPSLPGATVRSIPSPAPPASILPLPDPGPPAGRPRRAAPAAAPDEPTPRTLAAARPPPDRAAKLQTFGSKAAGKRPSFRAPKPRAGRSVRPPRRPPSTHGATDPMPGRSVWSGLGAGGCACGNPARRPGRAW